MGGDSLTRCFWREAQFKGKAGRIAVSSNTPFHGREVRGKVRHTVFNGEPVVIDGKPTR